MWSSELVQGPKEVSGFSHMVHIKCWRGIQVRCVARTIKSLQLDASDCPSLANIAVTPLGNTVWLIVSWILFTAWGHLCLLVDVYSQSLYPRMKFSFLAQLPLVSTHPNNYIPRQMASSHRTHRRAKCANVPRASLLWQIWSLWLSESKFQILPGYFPNVYSFYFVLLWGQWAHTTQAGLKFSIPKDFLKLLWSSCVRLPHAWIRGVHTTPSLWGAGNWTWGFLYAVLAFCQLSCISSLDVHIFKMMWGLWWVC